MSDSDRFIIENRTTNDWLLPLYGEEERPKVAYHMGEDGEVVQLQDTETVRVRVDNVHIPPTLDPQNPGEVEVDAEVVEAWREMETFESMLDARELDIRRAE